jgi:signal transduction histidine kinase
MLLIGADLGLPDLLGHVIEEARSITGARYGAIGVLNGERTALAEFITVGLTPEEEDRIGHRPKGLGLLGSVITDPQPLRITDVSAHPDSAGFPPDHPPMTSFLGVPIGVQDKIYGNLYLTDKIGWSEFTDDDLVLTEAFAHAAGIAIENARLHEGLKDQAVQDDRQRLARDLHDHVIQRLFGAGLVLQGIGGAAKADGLADRLNEVVDELDQTIREIRSTIFKLGIRDNEQGLRLRVLAVLQGLSDVVGFEVTSTFSGPVDTEIPDAIAEHVLAVVREAVTNIGRHAKATRASMLLSADDNWCRLEIVDDGQGIGTAKASEGGLGLGNMRRRAEELNGRIELSMNASGGTKLEWEVPVRQVHQRP